MSFRDIRRKVFMGVPLVVIPTMALFVGYQHCKSIPDAVIQIGVESRDFSKPVAEAMSIWNRSAGCTIFVPGKDVLFLSTMGEPCGEAFHPLISDGHSAGTYQCDPTTPSYRGYRWEIHVERPGNLRTQTCIAIHELGHVAGFGDSFNKSHAMYTEWCPLDGHVLWPSDWEQRRIREDFCY